MFSNNLVKKMSKLSLIAMVLGTVAVQSMQGLSAEASEVESPKAEFNEKYSYGSSNIDSDMLTPFSGPSQGGTGGGGYSQVFHQYGSSRSATQAKTYIAGYFVGLGLSWIPGVNSFAAYLVGPVITHALTNRSVVYYKVSTYITKTSNRGRQVRATIITYSDSARTKVLRTNTELKYEY